MENLWGIIAKERGVVLEEEFHMGLFDELFKIAEDGLFMSVNDDWLLFVTLNDFIRGNYEIIKIPFKPKDSEKYWFVESLGAINFAYMISDDIDLLRYKIGNCYKTAEEAKMNSNKHVKEFEEIKIELEK